MTGSGGHGFILIAVEVLANVNHSFARGGGCMMY